MENQKFASYLPIPQIPYKIIEKLALDQSETAQNLWKLLKYPEVDCLSFPNLTTKEKVDLMWSPEKTNSSEQNKFNVFLKPLVSSSLNDSTSQTQLKIYRYKNTAQDQYSSVLLYELDVSVSEMACMVRDTNNVLVEKTDLMEVYLIDLLSGLDLGIGINFLRFDRLSGGACLSQLNINDSKAIFGRSFLLALKYFDSSNGGGCS